MSILSRFADIISANINALLEKAEDPAKMIDQYLIKAKEDLAQVKQETAGVMAEETRCKRLMDDAQEAVDKYESLAKKALAAGNEGDARQLIAKKQELEKTLIAATNNYSVAKANADKMRQLYEKLSQDVATLQARRSNIKATVAVAKTQARINEATAAAESAHEWLHFIGCDFLGLSITVAHCVFDPALELMNIIEINLGWVDGNFLYL